MKLSRLRLRLADSMLLVLIAALDSAAIRAFEGHELLVIGALPTGNVLTFAWLVGRRRRGIRPFLACGVVALALFVVPACYYRVRDVEPYLDLYFDPLEKVVSPSWPDVVVVPICVVVGVVALAQPQLVLALVGGFIFRKYWSSPAPDHRGSTP